MIRRFEHRDKDALTALWNTVGLAMGYAPLDPETLDRLIWSHPAFSRSHTFLLEREGAVRGFALGCV